MINAMTKDGLIAPIHTKGKSKKGTFKPAAATEWKGGVKFGKDYTTSGWVFEASDHFVKDYHKTMNSYMFMNWVKHMLLPSFKARYPGKEMILMLDNAPYHHHQKEGGFRPSASTTTKGQCIEKLEELEIESIEIERNGGMLTFWCDAKEDDDNLSWRKKSPKGPSTQEIKDAMHKLFVDEYPDLLDTELSSFARDNDITLLFTPPYCPKFQPIERFWGWTKNFAAQLWVLGRTMTDLYKQIMFIWYGGDTTVFKERMGNARKEGGFTKELAASFVKQCQNDMNEWIVKIASKKGKMGELEWEDLEREHEEEELLEEDLDDVLDAEQQGELEEEEEE